MNERIRPYDPELAKSITLTGQALIKELIEQADYKAPASQWKEYFAELIVQECIWICDSFSEECSPNESHSDAIKKHFGVK